MYKQKITQVFTKTSWMWTEALHRPAEIAIISLHYQNISVLKKPVPARFAHVGNKHRKRVPRLQSILFKPLLQESLITTRTKFTRLTLLARPLYNKHLKSKSGRSRRRGEPWLDLPTTRYTYTQVLFYYQGAWLPLMIPTIFFQAGNVKAELFWNCPRRNN